MTTALRESAPCRTREGPHHHCSKAKVELVPVCVLVLYTASLQLVVWHGHLGNPTPTADSETHCTYAAEACTALFDLKDVDKRIKGVAGDLTMELLHTHGRIQ